MIGIVDIATYLPNGRESNLDRIREFGVDELFLREKIGVIDKARLEDGQDTSDLCVKAFENLLGRRPLNPAEIGCVVVCTQNPDGNGIPHTAAVVHSKLGLSENCAAFDISLGCSGFVYALSIVSSFMTSNGLRNGLLFTADPYSKIVDPKDRNTAMLFGDGCAATLLSEAPPSGSIWLPRAFAFATRGSEGQALNNAGGRLEMNGRAVFGFSATAVPGQIRELMSREGLTVDQIDLFLLHQGSKFIVDTLRDRLKLPQAKVPLLLEHCGNTVSSTIPMLMDRFLRESSARRIVISGFGVGLSWATAILEKKDAGT